MRGLKDKVAIVAGAAPGNIGGRQPSASLSASDSVATLRAVARFRRPIVRASARSMVA